MRNPNRTSLVISVVFHTVLIVFVGFFAAREGILGTKLKTLAVIMVPKEKPPEPPKEKPPEEKPEPPKEEPKVAKAEIPQPKPDVPQPSQNQEAAPAVAAPTAVTLPTFDFAGGRQVISTDDPGAIYKQWVEYSLRSKWTRPETVNDQTFVAEVWLFIDPAGKIDRYEWQKQSGDKAWDRSVQLVLDGARTFNRPPPRDFPSKILVRFDVEEQQVLDQ